MQAKDKIIVAIDTSDLNHACELVEKLSPYVGCFKFGLEFNQSVLRQMLVADNSDARVNLELFRHLFGLAYGKIFWDGKFHDISNTVAGASRETAEMGIKFFNVHASSGIKAVKRAVANKGKAKVLVVTVLTSLNFEDLWNIGFGRCVNKGCQKYYTREWEEKFARDLVKTMAMWSKGNGADGVVCSPQELALLKNYNGLKITPGIRPKWARKGDQKRIMTPREAILRGADYLVIGRPITSPPTRIGTPIDAVKLIIEEIEKTEQEIDNAQ